MRAKRSAGDKVFDAVVAVIIGVLAMLCFWPFLNIGSVAFSSNSAIVSGKVSFFPIGFQTDSFTVVLRDSSMWRSYKKSTVSPI